MFMVWLVVLYGADQGLVLITRLKPVTTANVKSHGKRSVICVTRLLKSTIFKFFITVTPKVPLLLSSPLSFSQAVGIWSRCR